MGTATAPHTALVHDWLTGMRGGEKVLEIFADLFPAAPIYTLLHVPGAVSPALEAHRIETSFLQRAPAVRNHYRRYLALFPAAVEDFDLSQFDLVVSTSHCVAKGVISAPDAFHLCYCFTPMRYAWDQEHVYFPQRRGLFARLRGLILSHLRAWDVTSAARVDAFVTISRYVAQRIQRYYRREATVVHPPVDVERFTPGPPSEREDYCLAVAAAVPYKRLDLAIAACEAQGRPLRIVADGPDADRLRGLAGPHTRVLGRVEDDELLKLYRQACCFVQPGVEDFGISSVEALACGTPVVALGKGGICDIVEDGRHGVLYAPGGDIEALSTAIDNCCQMRFNHLDLRRRAEAFSVERFRREISSHLARRSPELEGLRA